MPKSAARGAVCWAASLETVKLGRNRLVSLPSGLFRQNRRLRTLELANNHLRQVNGGLLTDLVSLVHLDLCHNYLLSLSEAVFHNSPEIHTLLLGEDSKFITFLVILFWGLRVCHSIFGFSFLKSFFYSTASNLFLLRIFHLYFNKQTKNCIQNFQFVF